MNINTTPLTKNNIDNNEAYYITTDSSILYSENFPNAQELNKEIETLLFTDQNKCIELLTSLIKTHPDEPILAYHLAYAYRKIGNDDFLNQIIENNYRKFPYFPVIRCDYVTKCLYEDRIMEAAAALNYTFYLPSLYPKRSHFHAVEILLFQSTITKYFCKIKDFERAVLCITQLQSINKAFPGINDLQNIITISILQEHLSTESIRNLLNFDEENRNNNDISNNKD